MLPIRFTEGPPMTSRIRRLWFVPLLAGALACPSGGPTELGAVLPTTGHAAVYGSSIRKGIELAHEQVQKDLEAPRIELLWADSGSDPDRGATELERVYKEGAIAAIGGVTSAEALAMVPVADRQNRILLSPSASLPQLTGISSNFFRIYPSDFSEGTVMAKFAVDTLRLRSAVILAKEETYAKGIQEVFADEFRRKGGQIVEIIEFPANTADFAALVDRVNTLKPDSVYVAAYATEILGIIRELRRQGFAGQILTTSSFAAAETIARTGADAENVMFIQTALELEGDIPPQVATFVSAYRAKYGGDPDLYAAHGYDAYQVLVEALRQGGTSASSFWKGMRNIREYPGVTGTFQFDEKGDVQKFPHVYRVQQGKALDYELERQRQLDEARKRLQKIQEEIERLKAQGN